MTYEQNYLAHHGVTGMKWGIRNYQNYDGTLTAEGRARYKVYDTNRMNRLLGERTKSSMKERLKRIVSGKDRPASARIASLPSAEVKKKKPKKLSEMTDQELQASINRLQNEKRYKELLAEKNGKSTNNQQNHKDFAQRHPLLKKVLVDTATNTLTDLASKQLGVKADELLAERRMARAKEKGMLNIDLKPFQYNTAKRNEEYNKSESEKARRSAEIKKNIEKAREASANEARREAKEEYEKQLKEYREREQKNLESVVNTVREKERAKQAYLAKEERARITEAFNSAVQELRQEANNQKNAQRKSAARSIVDLLSRKLNNI